MSEIRLTESNFDQEVMQSEIPVVVDFWATWCGPCQMLAPVLEEVAEAYEGKVKVGKVNVDEEMSIAMKYHISSIPKLLMFKNGEVVNQSLGFLPKESLEKFFNSHL